MRPELPAQVLAGHELAQTRVERRDVIVLEVDLDEGLPVVVALVQLDAVEDVAGEVEVGARADPRQLGGDVAAGRLGAVEQHPVPGLDRVVGEVAAGVVGEVRRADQLAAEVVGPAVQRADDVAAGVAAAAQHHRLAVPADVRDHLQAGRRAQQGPALALLRQGVVVADLRHGELVADVARGTLEQRFLLAGEQSRIEVAADRQLGQGRRERLAGDAQVGHGSGNPPKGSSASVGSGWRKLAGRVDRRVADCTQRASASRLPKPTCAARPRRADGLSRPPDGRRWGSTG